MQGTQLRRLHNVSISYNSKNYFLHVNYHEMCAYWTNCANEKQLHDALMEQPIVAIAMVS